VLPAAVTAALGTIPKKTAGAVNAGELARASSVGTFVVPPTRIEAMYSPEVLGRTAASTLSVKGT
jgi:alpha-2-macroglobulin